MFLFYDTEHSFQVLFGCIFVDDEEDSPADQVTIQATVDASTSSPNEPSTSGAQPTTKDVEVPATLEISETETIVGTNSNVTDEAKLASEVATRLVYQSNIHS